MNSVRKLYEPSDLLDFSNLKVSKGLRPEGFRFFPFIYNIESTDGLLACGEASSKELALTKAYAEWIERKVMSQYSQSHPEVINSNGWASHVDVESARENAIFERIERDGVLAQWYLRRPFLEMEVPFLSEWVKNELHTSEFPVLKVLLSTEGLGPSVTCLLMNESGYGVSGHSSRVDLKTAVKSALAETCRAAHHALRKSYWKDTLCLRDRESVQVLPGAHAVYYVYHEPFPSWMFGEKLSFSAAGDLWKSQLDDFYATAYDTFLFHQVESDPLVVGFAQSDRCLDLHWGSKPRFQPQMKARFGIEFEQMNLKPHIVS